ncbi:MAG: transcriptional regulator, TraR/DksA family [Thermoleophilia bacterium]|jgi:DnaK suppressor protein|nr:transcriptional regulator, TraR/DksA family [Thermoleophilia bacterium]
MPLTAAQIELLTKQMRSERVRILGNIAGLRDEFGDFGDTGENGLETHIGDQGTMTFLRERDLGLEEHEEHLVEEIDAALQRLKDGTYGRCEVSDEEIPFERLEAYPWARTTIEHATA